MEYHVYGRINLPKSKARNAQTVPGPEALALEGRLERLAWAITEVRAGRRLSPRTIKLLKSGRAKMAQKVIEEAAELGIEAVQRNRAGLVGESVDLLYNLLVLWADAGLQPSEIAAEMDRRERLLGMAEKLPKTGGDDS
jgi:phosphoribosyl-ATP pyrophosphohydrolase